MAVGVQLLFLYELESEIYYAYCYINNNYFHHNNSTSGTKNAHANPYGAEKLTRFIGEILLDNYAISPVYDNQWECTRTFNEGLKKDFLLCHETDLETYLSMINDNRYTIFIAAKDNAFFALNENLQIQLNKLGLTANWNDALKKSYFAVIEQGNIIVEKMAEEHLEYLGSFQKKKVIYHIVSAGPSCGNDCSIQINYQERANKNSGLNIVVYSHDTKSVIDSVCFDTCSEELTAIR